MAGELFINGRLVDIDQDAPFPLTFNISDIKDLNARKGNKSKTITLPGTRNNTSLMLSVYTLSATDNISGTDSDFVDFDPSIKAEAQYYQNGLLEFNGVAQLMSCKLMNGIWSFEITLVSDTIDYISRLAKIKVNELGFSEYNHSLTYANQQDTWNGTIQLNGSPSSNQDSQGWTGRGYYYGLIDYGFTRPSASTFGVEHIPPQVFCYEILEKAFNYCGISWDSDFLESQLFKKLLMAYPGGDLPTITQAQSEFDSTYTLESNSSTGYIINNTINRSSGFIGSFQLNRSYGCSIVQDDSSQLQVTNPFKFVSSSKGLFDINYYGNHDVTLNLNNNAGGTKICKGDYKLSIYIYKDNNLIERTKSTAIRYKFTKRNNILFVRAEGPCDTTEFKTFTNEASPPPQTGNKPNFLGIGTFTNDKFNTNNLMLTLGVKKMYFRFKTNYEYLLNKSSYDNSYNGQALENNESNIYNYPSNTNTFYSFTQDYVSSRLSITAGFMLGKKSTKIYFGGGYGVRDLYWKINISDYTTRNLLTSKWTNNTSHSYRGGELESGLFINIGRMTLMTGASAIFNGDKNIFIDGNFINSRYAPERLVLTGKYLIYA